MEPQLDFRRQFGWDIFDNTIYEETEAGGVDVIQLRSRRGYLLYHELVTAPKYCGEWLVDENKWHRVKHPYHKQICTNRSRDFKIIIRWYCRCTKRLFLCFEFYATRVLDADT